MEDIDPEDGLKFSKKSKRKKRICHSFCWFYVLIFVEFVLLISISTVALYLAFMCRRLKFLLCQKSQSFYRLRKIFFLFCTVFILTAFILSYSYCKDLFYLYCRIPDIFGQWWNMLGSTLFVLQNS